MRVRRLLGGAPLPCRQSITVATRSWCTLLHLFVICRTCQVSKYQLPCGFEFPRPLGRLLLHGEVGRVVERAQVGARAEELERLHVVHRADRAAGEGRWLVGGASNAGCAVLREQGFDADELAALSADGGALPAAVSCALSTVMPAAPELRLNAPSKASEEGKTSG